jgi:Ca-activated chloride channel family protein
MSAIYMGGAATNKSAVLSARTGVPPLLKGVEVKGVVTGLLFEVNVEQRYVNASAENIEAVYTFPLPWGAVLLGMEFVIGDKTLRGEVAPKADSEVRYEAAIEAGDTAIMLERASDGLYTVNIGNLLAKEAAIVRFRYAMLLSFEQGRVRMAIPTVIAPRFGSPTMAHLRAHQVPVSEMLADYPCDVSIVLDGAVQSGRISSPSHSLAVRQIEGRMEVSLANAARMDRDFVLLVDGLVGSSLTVVGDDGDGQVALASFCPRMEEPPYPTPVAIKILVDCSGSMNGDSIASARRALHEVLQHLIPADRFSFSRFGDQVVHHAKEMLPATSRALREGSHWIAATSADLGGTEMGKALQSTYALGRPHAADILLITDGEVWNVEQLVAEAASSGQRIFAVGIGSAPATSLLHTLASKSGGACEFIGVNDDIEGAILRMFKRMRQSQVKDLAVHWDAPVRWQLDPGAVAFSGETVHVFAGFSGELPTAAVMEWSQPDSADKPRLAVEVGAARMAGDTLARVAAMMRLPGLGKLEQHGLAMEYQLVTDSTNLLVILERGESDKPLHLPELRMVPQMAAAGWGGAGSVVAGSGGGQSKSVAVWRRESASEQIRARENNGMEAYDIPVFLRKGMAPAALKHQATALDGNAEQESKRAVVLEYLYLDDIIDFLRCIDSGQSRTINSGGLFPATFAQLARQVPSALMPALLVIREEGYHDEEIIHALLARMADYTLQLRIPERLLAQLRALKDQPIAHPELYARLGSLLEVFMDSRQPVQLNDQIQPQSTSRSMFRGFWRKQREFDMAAFLRKQAD